MTRLSLIVCVLVTSGLGFLGCGDSSGGGGVAPVGSNFQVTTSSLPDGSVGNVYSATLTTANGSDPYTWAVVQGALPPGINLNTMTGHIGGTPTMGVTSTIIVRVTDGGGQQAEKELSFGVANAAVDWASTPNPPAGNVGTPYSFDLKPFVTGGTQPYSFSISQGRLPTDLVLNSDGTITGTPSVAETTLVIITVTSSPDPVTNAITADTQQMTFTVN